MNLPELYFHASRTILGEVRECGTGNWDSYSPHEVALRLSQSPSLSSRARPGRTRAFFEQCESARSGTGHSPEVYYWIACRSAVVDLFNADLDPARRRHLLWIARRSVPLPLLTGGLDVVKHSPRAEGLVAVLDRGVGEAHVHSGAATPFADVLASLLNQTLEVGRPPSAHGIDSLGSLFDVALTAVAVRIGWRIASRIADRRGDFGQAVADSQIRQHVEQGTYWDHVGSLARGPSHERSSDRNALFAEAASPFSNVSLDVLDEAIEFSTTEGERTFIAELLRATTVISLSCTPVPGEGLNSFVSRFDSLRAIRRTTTGGGRTLAVRRAVRHATAGKWTRRLELRKTEHPQTSQFSDVLRSEIAGHLRGAAEAITGGDELALSVPIGFLRSGRLALSEARAQRTARFDLRPQFVLVDAWEELSKTRSGVAPLISSFDVAGDEDAFPNWPFSLIFAEIAARARQHGSPRPRFAVHAGEFFPTPLDGLRRVGEVLLFDEIPSRVGHALSLDVTSARAQSGDSLEGLRLCSLDEIIDTLSWAMRLIVRGRSLRGRRP